MPVSPYWALFRGNAGALIRAHAGPRWTLMHLAITTRSVAATLTRGDVTAKIVGRGDNEHSALRDALTGVDNLD